MPEATLPVELKDKLLKQGYSERMVKELCKWYFPSENKDKADS